VLLTDLEMPNMNGLELTAHVRQRTEHAGLPVIMITSRSMDKHRRQATSAGVNVYLTKPYTDFELLQHVATAVTGRIEKRVAAG
jgi:CheY-like chemotaxis protein